ncbi:MAG: hypothetical protein IPM21_12075 [Acidobacteria bacterium]|nr:hypothetical protein [Acidobacteriota bacterium]
MRKVLIDHACPKGRKRDGGRSRSTEETVSLAARQTSRSISLNLRTPGRA